MYIVISNPKRSSVYSGFLHILILLDRLLQFSRMPGQHGIGERAESLSGPSLWIVGKERTTAPSQKSANGAHDFA
jgi:hypothetical protein